MPRRSPTFALVSLPAILFLGLTLRSLDYDFVWTDQAEIERGVLIRPTGDWLAALVEPMHPELETLSPGSSQPYYRPLQVIVASWIDAELGRAPRSFRAFNLALGALTALLFTLLARALLPSDGAALVAGLVFAAHPVGIETYVWIAGLSQALGALCVVAAVGAGLGALRTGAAPGFAAWLAASLAAAGLGLLSKENSVVVPVLLAAVAAGEASRRRAFPTSSAWRGRVAGLVGSHAALALAYVVVWRPRVLGGSLAGTEPLDGSPATQVWTSLATWPESLAWLVLPLHSTTSDVVRVVHTAGDLLVWLALLLAGASVYAFWRLLRAGHATAALGLAWVWIAFAPTSGLVPLTHLRAERYLFLSVFGVALLWSAAGPLVLGSLQATRSRWLAPALAGLLVLGLAWRTAARVPDWRSDVALFQADVRSDPLYREGYYTLAHGLVEEGRYEEAKQVLERLFSLGRRFAGHTSFLRETDVATYYCGINLQLGTPAATLDRFANLRPDATALARHPRLYFCGASSLEAVGREDEALAIYGALLALGPSADPEIVASIARVHARAGRAVEARRWLARIPDSARRSPALADEIDRIRAFIDGAPAR